MAKVAGVKLVKQSGHGMPCRYIYLYPYRKTIVDGITLWYYVIDAISFFE
jgi:hypothetical protein